MEQHSIEWYKARLGKITGSMVYVLMGTPRKKDEQFTDTAKSYLYQLAAERNISDLYLHQRFDEWLQRNNHETSAMRYGTETEQMARDCYNMQLPDGMTVKETGFAKHSTLPNYGSSPDGVVYNIDKDLVGVLEIKCPNPNTWMMYRDGFRHGKTLKEVESKYYWQCQSHMLCTGTDWCDFVFFDKMQKDGLQIVRIDRNESDITDMSSRITAADEYINHIIK